MECQGGKIKEGAILSLVMCETGTRQRTSGGECHLYKVSLGSLTCSMCSCGAGAIWGSSGVAVEKSSSSPCWTDWTAADTKYARKAVCLAAWLPLPKSMSGMPENAATQEVVYHQLMRALILAGQLEQVRTAAVRRYRQSPTAANLPPLYDTFENS